MDEPFGALDPITRSDIRKEFLELPELKRKTILLVTHDVLEAFELGDQISLMDRGRIIQSGPPQELVFKPVNDFVGNFFSHQKLQLELSSLTLCGIWDTLPYTELENGVPLAINATFWEALERLSENKRASLTIRESDTNSLKSVTFENVMSAYLRIKQNR